jgi:general secretion pathway protein A
MNKMMSIYGLTRLPFSKDIPASEMLDTEGLQAARERLQAALEGRASAVVTGDSGSGKTCLLRAMEEHLPQGRYRIHYVHNATVNRRDFYRQLSIGMGLEPRATFAALFAAISQQSRISLISISCASFCCWTRRISCRCQFSISCISS